MPDTSPVYIILGATGGIGSVLTRQLAAQGAQLVIGARDETRLTALAQETDATAHPLDATDIGAIDDLVTTATQTHDRLDGIVNLVGSILLKPAHQTKLEEWEDTLALNLTSAFGTVRAAAKAMRKNGGSIVLMSSGVARAGYANHEAIAAAKAGVIGLMQSAAATYAGSKIRVNAVAPGLVRTPLAEPLLSSEAAEKASRALHALNEIGEPEQVADMIAWLLDPAHHWVTGQVFGVDGGLSTVRPRMRV